VLNLTAIGARELAALDQNDSIELRPLGPLDAAAYRALRLEGLENSPESFSASFEDEVKHPLAWFEDRLRSSIVYGAFLEGGLVGVAGIRFQTAAKTAHIGLLWGVYVKPRARRRGLSAALARRLIEIARGRVEQIHLAVASSNQPAFRVYAGLGFKQYGLERRALKIGERRHDEILMALFLNESGI
jgi:RimJ/RimL family protein N-acetyltransferase